MDLRPMPMCGVFHLVDRSDHHGDRAVPCVDLIKFALGWCPEEDRSLNYPVNPRGGGYKTNRSWNNFSTGVYHCYRVSKEVLMAEHQVRPTWSIEDLPTILAYQLKGLVKIPAPFSKAQIRAGTVTSMSMIFASNMFQKAGWWTLTSLLPHPKIILTTAISTIW